MQVSTISLLDDGTFEVEFHKLGEASTTLLDEGSNDGRAREHSGSKEKTRMNFDIVVVATPLTKDKSDIKFRGLPVKPVFPWRYGSTLAKIWKVHNIAHFHSFHRTVATFVHGAVDPGFLANPGAPVTATNFYIGESDELNSIALQTPADYTKKMGADLPQVWKIFSQAPLSESKLDRIFAERKETRVFDWLAYPNYRPEQKLGDFVLHAGLYHVNAIEWAASAMEMSVIGAKNVANLAHDDWLSLHPAKGGKTGKTKKTEL